MRISDKVRFLVLSFDEATRHHSINITASVQHAVRGWVPTTRISPVFRVLGLPGNQDAEVQFKGQSYLVFLGPERPDRILEQCRKSFQVWIGIGAYNLVVASRSERDIKGLLRWAKGKGIRYESWDLTDERIANVSQNPGRSRLAESSSLLKKLSDISVHHDIQEAAEEYLPLIASTITRCAVVTPTILDDLMRTNELLLELLDGVTPDGDSPPDHVAQAGILTTINAALSRFSSQAYSGSSPIMETECHFWNHSLLGTGVANLALINIRRFVERTLGEARIPQRIEALEKTPNPFGALHNLEGDSSEWHKDWIGSIKLSQDHAFQKLFPLITYLSGRDGFKSTPNTLSAPTNIVSSCNSLKWSMLTLTHEISHTIIRAILADLLPDINSQEAMKEAVQLRKSDARATLRDELRYYLLTTILYLEQVQQKKAGLPNDPEHISLAIEHFYSEVEELMVHVFDYLYFYSSETNRYVRGIWTSWGTIPYISNRIPDYVLRTLCAVSAKFLTKPHRTAEMAHMKTFNILKSMKDESPHNTYVSQGLRHLTEHWDDAIQNELQAHLPLTYIVKAFLYSETIMNNLQRELFVEGKAARHEGYRFSPKVLSGKSLSNPLRFVRLYTAGQETSAAKSAWMLSTLAFNTHIDGD